MQAPDLIGFAQHMTCWLDPGKVLEVVYRLSNDPDGAFTKSELLLAAQYISPERDGGLRGLVEAFLERFRIPSDVLLLLRQLDRRSLPDRAWDVLGSLRFKGEVLEPPVGVNSPTGQPMLLVRDADAVIDLVAQPLAAIQGTVAMMAKNWKELRETDIPVNNIWLRHGSPDPIATWIEGYVANACGFSRIARYTHIPYEHSSHFRYRAITLVGWSEPSNNELDAVRELARNTAASTREIPK